MTVREKSSDYPRGDADTLPPHTPLQERCLLLGPRGALGKIKMQGYDKDDLSGMVEKITSGSTKALGNIEMEGYSSDNLTSMLEKVTEGATGALSEISMDGLDESEFQDLVEKIGDGATNSLVEIRMTGYDHEKPPSDLTDKINLGTNDGFKKLKTRVLRSKTP